MTEADQLCYGVPLVGSGAYDGALSLSSIFVSPLDEAESLQLRSFHCKKIVQRL